MIAKVLEEAGHKIAVASTINFKLGEKEWVNKSKFTTLSSFALQKFLHQAVAAKCEYAVLEVSSHSLDQNRVWGVNFLVAVITNVTREHLDYHNTIDIYAQAKEKLFRMAVKNKNSVGVVNLQMEKADNFLNYDFKKKYGYGIKVQSSKFKVQSDSLKFKTIIAENIKLGIKHSQFSILNSQFSINLPGEFNIENALAAICAGLSQDISLGKISNALSKIKGVPGRMEHIENDHGIEVIVDYALTPDSLEKLYSYVSKLKSSGSKIIAVFGSCGERDRGKRPIMGEIVASYADLCIVTNEDPYNEDPQQIIDEVFEGVLGKKEEFKDAWRIMDRREAIKKALELAEPGGIVVITGKGAEEIMVIGAKRIPWNDPKVIREVLRELG
jgi:UDP-N-acetylmuramoyl-L-alanyl-D-glutamate--2,6-diaminopimelate ligase